MRFARLISALRSGLEGDRLKAREMQMHGLFRDGEWAQVSDGLISVPIPRDRYLARGYEPPFEKLPTKKEYDLEKADGS